jgi:predicted AAA+ superfamily ATPase
MRHRLYLDLFYPLLTDRSIRRGIILMGPRRVGKTVLFHIEKLMSDGINPQKIIYFSIDNLQQPVAGGTVHAGLRDTGTRT